MANYNFGRNHAAVPYSADRKKIFQLFKKKWQQEVVF